MVTPTPTSGPSRWRTVHAWLTLPHAVPIVVVLTATAAFALVATGGWPGLSTALLLLGAMLGGQVAVGAVNELVDADLDAVSRPDKPIPAGLVSRRGARSLAAAGVAAMLALSLPLGWTSLAICALGNGVGVAYSFWFKRTVWAWVPYLVALPLIPIWVWVTLDAVDPGLFAIYPIGAAAVVAVQLAQSLPDVAVDRAAGVRTLAVVLGDALARRTCRAAMLLAAALIAALAPALTESPTVAWLGAGVAVALVVAQAVVERIDRRRGTLACFPLVAAATVTLGVGWALALVGVG